MAGYHLVSRLDAEMGREDRRIADRQDLGQPASQSIPLHGFNSQREGQ